ncbi:hypothetical protein [Rhizobium sp. CECT 9324]|uniref:hypothetical protein n=1 Tax=Rhizobium sp. CECT 9324 TaxID=2845820 RepID=UPI001E651335|nr:hypothetical protein [Rhizobium sp. CECT 9324]CAH0343668.1 hypothetical protein RHI9324_05405 [Rhizobium sp. CECT 9324]
MAQERNSIMSRIFGGGKREETADAPKWEDPKFIREFVIAGPVRDRLAALEKMAPEYREWCENLSLAQIWKLQLSTVDEIAAHFTGKAPIAILSPLNAPQPRVDEMQAVAQRGKDVIAELALARSQITDPTNLSTSRNEAVIKLHDAIVAAKAEARSGNPYVLDHAKRYPTEYGFLDDGFDEDSEVRAYERAIETFGELNVAAVNEALYEIETLHQSLSDLERPEPTHNTETGAYTYDVSADDAQTLTNLRANAERQIDAAWQRLMAFHDDGNGYVQHVAQSNAELFARVNSRDSAWEMFEVLHEAGHAGEAVPKEAYGNARLLGFYERGLKELETELSIADDEIGLGIEPDAVHPITGYNSEISEAQWENLAARKAELESARDKIPGTFENPIQIGHTAEQQLRYALSSGRENHTLEAIKASVNEKIKHINVRLTDRDSEHFISEDSYATRVEANDERRFLERLRDQLETVEPGGHIDLSRTVKDFGYDPEEAQMARWNGIEYVPWATQESLDHRYKVEQISSVLEQLKTHDITVDTSFTRIPSEYEEEDEYHLGPRATSSSAPGTFENPIQIGHTAEQQMKYAFREKSEAARESRVIHNSKPDSVEMFRELYQDVVRTGDSFPIGALERHAEGRLQQTYAALVLIENAKAAGIIPENSKFVATGAKVQDKRASKEYPAAHRLPADLSIQAADGSLRRLTDHLDVDLGRIWVDQNIFAPTDRIHRLANVADQWVEDGGMKTAFVSAANAVSSGKMTAEEALEDIVQPGYAAAHARALEKVERNFTLIERQALSQRIVDQHGQPYRKVPEPTVLRIKGLEERAAAKDVMERTLKAYSRMEELSPSLRMKSNLAVNGVIDNEIRLREHGPNSRRVLAPGEAMVEARRAAGEANAALTKQMDEVIQLGNKASAAAVAAADPSRPMEARMRAMGDAGAYGEAMKTAWAKLQRETGPKVVKGLSDRLERCGPHAGGHLAAVTARLASPPKEVLQASHEIDDAQEKLQRANRSQVDYGQQNSPRTVFGQRPSPSLE